MGRRQQMATASRTHFRADGCQTGEVSENQRDEVNDVHDKQHCWSTCEAVVRST